MSRAPRLSGAFLGAADGGGKVQPVVAPFIGAVENGEASGAEVACKAGGDSDIPPRAAVREYGAKAQAVVAPPFRAPESG